VIVRAAAVALLLLFAPGAAEAQEVTACGSTTQDSDHDGLSDACELEVAQRFAPWLVVAPTACNWQARHDRLGGGYLFGVAPTATGMVAMYLPAYFEDCGWSGPKCWVRWGGGCAPHDGDSEIIVVEASWDSTHSTRSSPEPTRVFLSAHCFGRSQGNCRWHSADALEWLDERPVVWVAEGKNANYVSQGACDSGHWHYDTCDRNDRHVAYPAQSNIQNIGSAEVPFPAHTSEPPCVEASELIVPPTLPGRECLWVSPRFWGWSERGEAGSTGYRRYLREILGLIPDSLPH